MMIFIDKIILLLLTKKYICVILIIDYYYYCDELKGEKMENASKALLIAGSILICIVLISVGMLVLGYTSNVTDQVGDTTTSQAAQAFNRNFTDYVGKQKGSAVKKLLGAIAVNNETNQGGHIIGLTYEYWCIIDTTSTNKILEVISWINNSETYTVEIKEMQDGYISLIELKDN